MIRKKLILLFLLLFFSLESYCMSNIMKVLYSSGIVIGLWWFKKIYNFNNVSHPNLIKLKDETQLEWPEIVALDLPTARNVLKKYAVQYRRYSAAIFVVIGVAEAESRRADELALSAEKVIQYKKFFDGLIQKKYYQKKSYEKPVIFTLTVCGLSLTHALLK